MKVLFVNACIREKSRTQKMCNSYLSRFNPEEIEVVDLNLLSILPLTRETLDKRDEDIQKKDLKSADYDLAKQFARADRIVVGAPYWDFFCPAVLKAYFEQVCVNGIAFGYPGGVPTGMCNAKELVYITTAGGNIPKESSIEFYISELCQLFGIPEFKFYKAEGLDIYGNDAAEIVDKFEF